MEDLGNSRWRQGLTVTVDWAKQFGMLNDCKLTISNVNDCIIIIR